MDVFTAFPTRAHDLATRENEENDGAVGGAKDEPCLGFRGVSGSLDK